MRYTNKRIVDAIRLTFNSTNAMLNGILKGSIISFTSVTVQQMESQTDVLNTFQLS